MPREKILSSPDYWFEKAQNELFRQFHYYMEDEKINQTQLADRLGLSKGRVSQILRGESNFTMKKLIELSLSIRKIAKINYISVDTEIEQDEIKRLEHQKNREDTSEKKIKNINNIEILHLDKSLPFPSYTSSKGDAFSDIKTSVSGTTVSYKQLDNLIQSEEELSLSYV